MSNRNTTPESMPPPRTRLEPDKRYLFGDRWQYGVWSATVLEVTPTHVYMKYDTGSLVWMELRFFCPDPERDDMPRYPVLHELQPWVNR